MSTDVSPPGREAQVEALSEKPGVDNPYAVAWASYNESGDCVDAGGQVFDVGEHADVIRKSKGKWVLHSRKTGKVLGTHATKEEAEAQERAIQASKHADEPEHAPAGTPEGGQFVAGKGGGGGGEEKKQTSHPVYPLNPTHEKMAQYHKQAAEFMRSGGNEKGAQEHEKSQKMYEGYQKEQEEENKKYAAEREKKAAEKAANKGKGFFSRFKKHDEDSPVRVRRFDAGTLASPERLPNGWMRVEGRIARVGIQEYQDAGGGTHRELRLPEEVFDPESLASFAMVPVTNTHPAQLLDSTTARHYSVGSVGERVRPDGDYVAAPFMITDADAIKAVEAGRVQLSNGYSCELEEVPGTWKGERYDSVQRKIRGNHLAIVDSARAGDGARIRLDSGDACAIENRDRIQHIKENAMPNVTLKLDGRAVEITEATAPLVQKDIEQSIEKARREGHAAAVKAVAKNLKLRADAKGEALKAVKHETMTCPECGGSGEVAKDDDDDADAMMKCDYCDGKGKVSALGEFGGDFAGKGPDADGDYDMDDDDMDADELATEQATEEEAKEAHKDGFVRRIAARAKRRAAALKRHDAAVERRARRAIKARVALESEARKHLGAGADLSKLDALGVKRAVVAKLAPQAKLDSAPEAVVEAAYLLEVARAAEAPNAVDAVRAATMANPKNAPVFSPAAPGRLNRADSQAAKDAMIKRNQDAWKRKQ